MSLSSVGSETALRSRLFSSLRTFRHFTCSVFSPPNSWRHRIQACIASLPLQSSWMSKTYLKSDHFNGGGSVAAVAAALQ